MHSRTRQCPELHTEHVRPQNRYADAAQPAERVALAVDRQSGNWLVAPRIERADRNRSSCRPIENAPIDRILGFLIRQALRCFEQKFGTHKANAVADRGIEAREFFRCSDVEKNCDPPTIYSERRFGAAGICERTGSKGALHAALELTLRFRLGIEDHDASIPIDEC